MILPFLLSVGEVVIVLALSIYIHELGHYFYLKGKLTNPELSIEGINPVVRYTGKLSKKHESEMLFEGISSGFIITLGLALIRPLHFLTFFFYIYGCKTDIVQLINIRGREQ